MIVIGYLVSLLMGFAVGAAYGLVQVRSAAPQLIALASLRGQQAIDAARDHFALTTPPVLAARSFRRAP